ncbi:MAG: hypothetical protein ACYS91_06595 [Planctomycetota bacterium]|jgi:hypothetical protein
MRVGLFKSLARFLPFDYAFGFAQGKLFRSARNDKSGSASLGMTTKWIPAPHQVRGKPHCKERGKLRRNDSMG